MTHVVPPGAGEVIGDAPDRRVEILCEHEALHATWSRFGPLRDGADLHVHREHTDLFFVLSGELAVRLGPEGSEVRVPAETLARVPRLVVHGFRNPASADVRYLNLHAPGRGFASFMRGLRDGRPVSYDQWDPPDDGGRPPSLAVVGDVEVAVDRPGLRIAVHADVDDVAVAVVSCDAGVALPAALAGHLYVLSGALTVGGASATAGAWVTDAPVPVADEPSRFVLVRAPGGGLRAALAEG